MYLYWFERIVAKMAGDPAWSLPYWNYSLPSDRSLPVPFRSQGSPLFANRDEEWNNGSASFKDTQVDYSGALAEANFERASSSLENSPHRNIHRLIQGWMFDKESAAQDPIFFLHHSNIDRLWDVWLRQTNGASDPIDDSAWRDKCFTFFNEDGVEVQMKVCDVLNSETQLGYTYEGEPSPAKQDCRNYQADNQKRKSIFVETSLLELQGFPFYLANVTKSFQIELSSILERIRSSLANKNQLILLNLLNVESPSLPALVWDVYLGPPCMEYFGAESPFFVGTLTLFEAPMATFSYPIGRALTESIKVSRERVVVALIPQGPLINGKPTNPDVSVSASIRHGSLSIESKQ